MTPLPFRREAMETLQEEEAPAVVIVTPYSTGCCIAQEVQRRGYKILCLWQSGFAEEMKEHVPLSCKDLKYDAVLQEQETIQATASYVLEEARSRSYTIVAVMCGGEAGVELSDALSEELGLLSNGTSVKNRRDKKVQQELVKAAGLRSVRQACGSKFEEVQTFLESEEYPVILKPLDSAGSDGVKLCRTFEEAKQHFHHLMQLELVNGGMCQKGKTCYCNTKRMRVVSTRFLQSLSTSLISTLSGVSPRTRICR